MLRGMIQQTETLNLRMSVEVRTNSVSLFVLIDKIKITCTYN